MASKDGFDGIPKLDGQNFHVWRRNMQMMLILKDLWSTLHDKEPEPGTPALKIWKKAQDQALAIIYLSCNSDQTPLIADCTTGKEAHWTVSMQRSHLLHYQMS